MTTSSLSDPKMRKHRRCVPRPWMSRRAACAARYGLVADHRAARRGVRHPVGVLLACATGAIAAGWDSYVGIAQWVDEVGADGVRLSPCGPVLIDGCELGPYRDLNADAKLDTGHLDSQVRSRTRTR